MLATLAGGSRRESRARLRYLRPVPTAAPRHILVLADRDWTHPQAGGTGTVLYGLISHWLADGHRVTVIAGSYDGAEPLSRYHERLEVHRMGSRLTVFPRAAWATFRGLGRDADAILEVCNGIAFNTPLWRWLRKPRVVLVFHVHQDHYVAELGRRGKVAAFLLERMPLTVFYRGTPVLTISENSRRGLVDLGIPEEQIRVVYLGLEAGALGPGSRAPDPALVYLGRLKQYKRIEQVIDVAAAIPRAHLHIAGDGDWGPVLEAYTAERGISDRVTFHGHVSEAQKAALLQESWVALTASSAEGWCLTVIEAGACATPTAALRVGGLEEAILDGRTGVLADDPQELITAVSELVADPERLEAMGDAAHARSRQFTWEASARGAMDSLATAAAAGPPRLRDALLSSESSKAAGLAAATLANNAIQLLFTVLFTRILGASGYGSLAALISAFLILLVAGQSVQVAAAREVALDRLGHPALVRATLRAWTERILGVFVALAIASSLLRVPISHIIGVPQYPWAAAAILPTGALWMLLSLQRGALQGLRAYRPVGSSIIAEAVLRLVCALILVAIGLGVPGAFLGTPVAFAILLVWLERALHAELGPLDKGSGVPRRLRAMLGDGWVAITALLFLAALQNVDVIMARHQLSSHVAGSYAAAAVAAKAVVFVAIGIGLQLLPEATRRSAVGLDPRPVLARALCVLALIAFPALLIFTLFPRQLLRLAFGPGFTTASGALPLLGLAMTLLAVAYLTVQYMVALEQTSFLWVLGVVAVTEPLLLGFANLSVVPFAAVVLAVQCTVAVILLTIGLRLRVRGGPQPSPAGAG